MVCSEISRGPANACLIKTSITYNRSLDPHVGLHRTKRAANFIISFRTIWYNLLFSRIEAKTKRDLNYCVTFISNKRHNIHRNYAVCAQSSESFSKIRQPILYPTRNYTCGLFPWILFRLYIICINLLRTHLLHRRTNHINCMGSQFLFQNCWTFSNRQHLLKNRTDRAAANKC